MSEYVKKLLGFLAEMSARLDDSAIPILIVIGALLGMVSLRNGHLAERARNNVHEALYDAMPKIKEENGNDKIFYRTRIDNLHDQNVQFLERYRSTSYAFVSMTASLILFVLATLLVKNEETSTFWQQISGTIAVISFIFLVIGLINMVKEFLIGPNTLIANEKDLITLLEEYEKERNNKR